MLAWWSSDEAWDSVRTAYGISATWCAPCCRRRRQRGFQPSRSAPSLRLSAHLCWYSARRPPRHARERVGGAFLARTSIHPPPRCRSCMLSSTFALLTLGWPHCEPRRSRTCFGTPVHTRSWGWDQRSREGSMHESTFLVKGCELGSLAFGGYLITRRKHGSTRRRIKTLPTQISSLQSCCR